MRLLTSSTIIILLLLTTPLSHAQPSFPFSAATPLSPHSNSCPNSADTQCSIIGEPSWCCPSTQRCAFDDDGDVACCPYGDSCRGVITYGGAPSGTATLASMGTTTAAEAVITDAPGSVVSIGSGSYGNDDGNPTIILPTVVNDNNPTIYAYNTGDGGTGRRFVGLWAVSLVVGVVLVLVMSC